MSLDLSSFTSSRAKVASVVDVLTCGRVTGVEPKEPNLLAGSAPILVPLAVPVVMTAPSEMRTLCGVHRRRLRVGPGSPSFHIGTVAETN